MQLVGFGNTSNCTSRLLNAHQHMPDLTNVRTAREIATPVTAEGTVTGDTVGVLSGALLYHTHENTVWVGRLAEQI